ncbi:histidinol-phosphatase [Halobacteriales archaeon QH_7_68_42]|nr:MAG: histidinol-phosphatase [Halobacteriales archaeon QH_7_68_42]
MTDSTSGEGRTVLTDPHVHTASSYDAGTTPDRLLSAARDSGLDAVVVTDHDTMEGARIVDRVADEDDPLVLQGCEVSTAAGHLLGIGIDGTPDPGRPLDSTVEAIRRQGGVAVVPHPFQRSRHGVAGRHRFGSSDAHSAASVGTGATAVDLPPGEPVTVDAVLDAMRAGRTRAVAGRVPTLRYLERVVTNATLKTQSLL